MFDLFTTKLIFSCAITLSFFWPIELMATNENTEQLVINYDYPLTTLDFPWIHTHMVVLVIPALFSISALHRELFSETRLWSGFREVRHRVPRCPHSVDKGALLHRRGEGSTPLLPSFTAARALLWQPMLPSCSGTRPTKPQADNECHTIVITCTFMEREERTSLARTLAVYDETSSINQTIKERAVRHLWNPWWEPWPIYEHYQKRAVSK